jgi:hypothetical protein
MITSGKKMTELMAGKNKEYSDSIRNSSTEIRKFERVPVQPKHSCNRSAEKSKQKKE